MQLLSLLQRPVPGFIVSVHTITIFLARLVLLIIVTRYVRHQAERVVRSTFVARYRTLEKLAGFLTVVVPVRLMCPGLLLRAGRLACHLSHALLPRSQDYLNAMAVSHRFWVAYGWAEIVFFLYVGRILYHHSDWSNVRSNAKLFLQQAAAYENLFPNLTQIWRYPREEADQDVVKRVVSRRSPARSGVKAAVARHSKTRTQPRVSSKTRSAGGRSDHHQQLLQ